MLRRVAFATSCLLVVGAATAAVVAGQGTSQTVTITVGPRSVSVAGAEDLSAGPTRVVFRTEARLAELEGVLVTLRPGRTLAQLRREIPRSQDSPTPIKRLATFEATGPPTRGQPYTTTIDLKPGATYVAANVGRNLRNTRLATFTVGTAAGGGTRPTPAATVGLYDYAFGMPARLPRRGVVRFENRGDHLHIAVAFPLRRGASRPAAIRALLRNQERRFQRLVDFRGTRELLGVVSPGTINDVEVNLPRAGNYVLACFIEDGERGRPPHIELGMAKAFSVR